MTFFPPDPEIPEPEEPNSPRMGWWEAPEDELPALLPATELLATTDHLAIALVGISVHSDGIQLRLERRLRRNGLPMREWNELCTVFMEHMAFGGVDEIAGRLRFGVVLADGQKLLADATPFYGGSDPMTEPTGHTLSRRQQGGGGGGSTYSSADHLWLWPLPPAGPVELVLQWPALGIEETHVAIDLTAVEELAALVQPFWPR